MIGPYILFAGHDYYPRGGLRDLCCHGSIEELKAHFVEHADEIAGGSYIGNWGQIVCAQTMRFVLDCDRWNGPGSGEPDWQPVDPP